LLLSSCAGKGKKVVRDPSPAGKRGGRENLLSPIMRKKGGGGPFSLKFMEKEGERNRGWSLYHHSPRKREKGRKNFNIIDSRRKGEKKKGVSARSHYG